MEANLKVLFLTKYSFKGPSSRYRFYNYENYFIQNNIHPDYKPLLGDLYIRNLYSKNNRIKKILAIYYVIKRLIVLCFVLKKYDHIVIEAELFPHFSFRFDKFFIKKMKSFSLDFDDNIAANYVGTKNENKIQKLMLSAKFVTVGNHWYIKEFKGNLIYLPTVIDLKKYDFFLNQSEEPSIVWIGSPSTQKYLLQLENVFARVNKIQPFTFKIIGGDIQFSNKDIVVEHLVWSAETENELLSKCTVGIMPLDNTFWEKGKCGFKLIQYMASGLPVVCSNLPANKEIVEEAVSGFVVETEEEWIDKLLFILQDRNISQEMGQNGRKRIENAYSYQTWGNRYAEIIKTNR